MFSILRVATKKTNVHLFSNKIQFQRLLSNPLQEKQWQKIIVSYVKPNKSSLPPSGAIIPLPIPYVANGRGGREYSAKYLWENRKTKSYLFSLITTLIGAALIVYEYYRFDENDTMDLILPWDLSMFIRGYIRNPEIIRVLSEIAATDDASVKQKYMLLALYTILSHDAEAGSVLVKHINFKDICEILERHRLSGILPMSNSVLPYYLLLAVSAPYSSALQNMLEVGVFDTVCKLFIESPSMPQVKLLHFFTCYEPTRQKLKENKELIEKIHYAQTLSDDERVQRGLKILYSNIVATDIEELIPYTTDIDTLFLEKKAMEVMALATGFSWGFIRNFAGYFKHIQSTKTGLTALKFSALGGLKNGVFAMIPFVIANSINFVEYEKESELNYMIARDQFLQLMAFQLTWLLSARTAPFLIVPSVWALYWGFLPRDLTYI